MSTIETISLTVPEEPAEMSVVLGKDGFAWQRVGVAWCSDSGTKGSWLNLLVAHSPLTVIYYATEDEL